MGKLTPDSIIDKQLDQVQGDSLNVCSAEIATYYEAVDPAAWIASTVYALNDAARPITRNGYAYQVTTAGTSGGSEPTWPTTPGATVVDGSVTWTCRDNYNLAAAALVGGDFVKANGDTNGRKQTVAAKSALAIHTSGTANHVAVADDATKELRDVTTNAAQALTSGGTVDTSAFDHENSDAA